MWEEFSEGPSNSKYPDNPTGDDCGGYVLPVEVLGTIAKELIAYGTCAALNMTSHSVHEETLQTLWRTIIHWGAKMLIRVPARVWGLTSETEETAVQQNAKKEVTESWNTIINAGGAKYIEYLVMPDFRAIHANKKPLASNIDEQRLGIEFPSLERLKVLITICDYAGRSGPAEGGIVHLTSNYEYGSPDIVELFENLGRFSHAAGRRTREILNVALWVAPHHQPKTMPPPFKARWSFPVALPQTYFQAPNIMILYNKNAHDRNNAWIDAFLDFAHWSSRFSRAVYKVVNSTVGVLGIDEKRMNMCARAHLMNDPACLANSGAKGHCPPPGNGLLPAGPSNLQDKQSRLLLLPNFTRLWP